MTDQNKAQILEELQLIREQQDLLLSLMLRDIVQTRALRNQVQYLHKQVLFKESEAKRVEKISLDVATNYIETEIEKILKDEE